MKKIDLHQDVVLSFYDQVETFSDESKFVDKTGRFSGCKQEYLDADLEVTVAAIWPYMMNGSMSDLSTSREIYKHLLSEQKKLCNDHGVQKVLSSSDLEGSGLKFLFHVEGMDFADSLDDIETFYSDGVRSIGFVWNFDNAFSGCNLSDLGLTDLGRQGIELMNEKGMIIDTAHMNHTSMMEVLDVTTQPIMNSHSNIVNINNHTRNVTDEFLLKLAENGGIHGLSVSSKFILGGGKQAYMSDYLEQIAYLRNLIGDEHVCLGTDFHGLLQADIVKEIGTIKGLTALEEHVVDAFGREFAEKFFYTNSMRFLSSIL